MGLRPVDKRIKTMSMFLPPESNEPSTHILIQPTKMIEELRFQYISGIGISQVNLPLYEEGGQDTELYRVYDGSILAVTIEANTAITAGTIYLRPTVDGVPIGSAALDATLTIGGIQGQAKVAFNVINFLDGNTLGLVANTTFDFAPITTTITGTLTIQYVI